MANIDIDPEWITLTAETGDEMVDKPPHYQTGQMECIDAMKAMADQDEICLTPHQSYLWQNSFKYLWRWPRKNWEQDLKKCRWYIDRLIQELEEDVK